MCLSTVYKKSSPEPLMSNVKSIENTGGRLVLTDIMERTVEVRGEILSVDLTGNKIFIAETAA